MEITPVFSVDRYIIGNGEAGEITTSLHKSYLEMVTGQIKGYEDWVTPIY